MYSQSLESISVAKCFCCRSEGFRISSCLVSCCSQSCFGVMSLVKW